MARRCYVPKNFSTAHLDIIEKANAICADYQRQGFDLTLRQLYYQFVARGWLENHQRQYNRLGEIVTAARLAGDMDWDYIVDRTRNLRGLPHWNDPSHIVASVAYSYRTQRWANQPHRVEVWIEKDALVGVIAGVCERYDVDYFSCRGYTSISEVYQAAQRLIRYNRAGHKPVILHLGDHDPSGVDMTRDIRDRLELFGANVEISRIALNMDQVEQYNPPPNPAKLTDSRATGYIEQHGYSSWELDALDPTTLDALIAGEIDDLLDHDQWALDTADMEEERSLLTAVSDRWNDVAEFVRPTSD
ncbi:MULTISPECIES: hypothetical protein [Nonomuraea]|uniref:DUF2399 domain-containing protein n=1 Tax=Nonomuraea africana TaxID=46171 RepID=A0ABR9KWX7_9ACTN|nr:hypothetical protein [Nonomuraea africana]MBE1566539.1 hypothetical protein [Nonomuraea africana]